MQRQPTLILEQNRRILPGRRSPSTFLGSMSKVFWTRRVVTPLKGTFGHPRSAPTKGFGPSDGLFGRFHCARGWRGHVRAAFEPDGIGGSDPQQALADPNCWQCPCPDLLVHLFAADKPILRQLRDGHVRVGMRFEVLKAHGFAPRLLHLSALKRAGGVEQMIVSADENR